MLQTCFASVSVGKDETLDGFFVDVVQTRHAGTVGLRKRAVSFLCDPHTQTSHVLADQALSVTAVCS